MEIVTIGRNIVKESVSQVKNKDFLLVNLGFIVFRQVSKIH